MYFFTVTCLYGHLICYTERKLAMTTADLMVKLYNIVKKNVQVNQI